MGKMRISRKDYLTGSIIAAAVVLLAFVWKSEYYFGVVCQILCYFIAAMGLNFITGLAGQPNMGGAGIFSVGAYTSALFCIRLDCPVFLSLIPAAILGWAVGKILGYPSLRIEGVYLSLTTIVFSEVVRIIMMNSDFSGGASGLKGVPYFSIFGWETPNNNMIALVLLAFAVVLAYIAYRITRSRWGRAFVAIKDNIEAVASCGINVAKMKISAFTLCCVFICLAGALYGHYTTYLNPASFNQTLSVSFVVMMIVGGMGTVTGALIGAIIVNLLPEILRFMGSYYQMVYCILVLLSIIFLPGGVVHTVRRARVHNANDFVRIFLGRERGER